MVTASKIEIKRNTIQPKLKSLKPKVRIALDVIMDYWAKAATSQMRSEATWEDQTGNARQGLEARAVSTPRTSAIVLYHTMPYGVWLELRWSGKYAIIGPVIRDIAPQVAASLTQILSRIG